MTRILCFSTLFFSLTAAVPLTASASANKCSSFNPDKLIAAATKACDKVDGKRFHCKSDKVGQVGTDIKEWLAIWNDLADNGGMTIGPRMLSWNASEHGKVIAPGDRTWISEGPASGGAAVGIRYLDGRAAVTISYCAVDASGNVSLLGMQDFQRKGPKKPLRFSAAEVDGKFIVVRIDGRKPWTRAYEYKISLKSNGEKPMLPTL